MSFNFNHMILSHISDSQRYESLHPLFKQVFDYIKTHDLLNAPTERIVLNGDTLFINVCDAKLVSAEAQKLEVHKKYIDIHFPLSGKEIVGWKHLSNVGTSEAPFDVANDFALYAEQPSTYYEVLPGEFYIVYPEDAHAPIIGEGVLRKLIVKVLLDVQNMVKFPASLSLALGFAISLLLLFTGCGGSTSNAPEAASADTVYMSSIQADSLSHSPFPLEWEDGEITSVNQESKLLVIDYVMAEEAFMSYYTMTEEERRVEQNYFCKILKLEELSDFVKQSKQTKSDVKINVIGITSRERFTVNVPTEDL